MVLGWEWYQYFIFIYSFLFIVEILIKANQAVLFVEFICDKSDQGRSPYQMYCMSLFAILQMYSYVNYMLSLAITKIIIYMDLIYHITKMYMANNYQRNLQLWAANGSWLQEIKRGMLVRLAVWVQKGMQCDKFCIKISTILYEQ